MILCDELFGEQQLNSWNNNKDRLIEHIKSQKDQFVLDSFNITDNDCIKRIGDSDYLGELEITCIDKGIKLLYLAMDIWNVIKSFIPKTITNLVISQKILLEDYDYLLSFPNLESLTVDSFSFDSIANKSIDKDIVLANGMYNRIYGDVIISSSQSSVNISWLRIKTTSIQKTINKIIKLLSLEDISSYESIIIEDNNIQYSYDTQRKILQTNDTNSSNIIAITQFWESKNIPLEMVEINVGSSDYMNIDLIHLKEVADRVKLSFIYENSPQANYEDFNNMVETIKWYRRLITDFELSPVEKLMFAYDIMKTFKYSENENNRLMARYPDKIVKSGNIVCVGYANFLREILKGIDNNLSINCSSVSTFSSKNNDYIGHERNLVRLDDEKYNIHGIFVLDATWDSVMDEEKAKSLFKESYNALDLYSYFLIPYCDYERTFGKDTKPSLFVYYDGVMNNNKDENSYKLTDWPVKQAVKDLFDKTIVTEDEVNDYLETKRPRLDDFLRMLYEVRLAEGYPENIIESELRRVEEINSNAVSDLQQSGLKIEFFSK